MASAHKAHAVCVPGPLQSHIKAMLKLAKLLNHKGFHITFVNTEYNHKRFLRARGTDALDGFSDFQFKTIPDDLPPSDAVDSTQDINALCQSILTFMIDPFSELLSKLNNSDSNSPPVSCIISDAIMPFTVKAAEKIGIPVVLFFTVSASFSFMGIYQFKILQNKQLAVEPDENCLTRESLDTILDWISGVKDMTVEDLPTSFRTIDRNDSMFNFCLKCMEEAYKASAIVIHTFEALEIDVLDALSRLFSHVYSIGPLQLLLNQLISEDQNTMQSIGYNLWKEEVDCFQWLESKEPNSVLYVNFGSVITMNSQQLIEFCWGLAESKCNFLWIIRPDLVLGDETILPSEFMAETKERGLISGWCPQEQVLNHPSIGGFLTHCGWNSTIESLSAGVPMLCCPFSGDQTTNCRYTCKEWQCGLEIDSNANKDELKRMMIELIDGETGKKLRNKALEWKNLAANATNPGGSSFLNLDKLVKQVAS